MRKLNQKYLRFQLVAGTLSLQIFSSFLTQAQAANLNSTETNLSKNQPIALGADCTESPSSNNKENGLKKSLQAKVDTSSKSVNDKVLPPQQRPQTTAQGSDANPILIINSGNLAQIQQPPLQNESLNLWKEGENFGGENPNSETVKPQNVDNKYADTVSQIPEEFCSVGAGEVPCEVGGGEVPCEVAGIIPAIGGGDIPGIIAAGGGGGFPAIIPALAGVGGAVGLVTKSSNSKTNTEAVPEPPTIFGSIAALGLGLLMQRKYSRIVLKKAKRRASGSTPPN